MSLIETLKSIGGVKPCPQLHFKTTSVSQFGISGEAKHCELCHGTGSILDLAPLLAKPSLLTCMVQDLHQDWWAKHPDRYTKAYEQFQKPYKNLHVVGPQRAHSLVYEVARQLGGQSVTVEDEYEKFMAEDHDEAQGREAYQKTGYRLSLLIPPDATVLFVTDRVDMEHEAELHGMAEAVNRIKGVIPYILCLIHRKHEEGPMVDAIVKDATVTGSTELKIIALYKENIT
jgi:hypothetical protein